MVRPISARAMALLKEFEAGPDHNSKPALIPYDDATGKYCDLCASGGIRSIVRGKATVGWGHVITLKDRALIYPLTIDQCQSLLDTDVAIAAAGVSELVRVPLTQGQYDALVLWCYNLGATNLRVSTLLKRVNECRDEDAVKEIRRWVYMSNANGHKRVSDGLVRRREAEAALYLSR